MTKPTAAERRYLNALEEMEELRDRLYNAVKWNEELNCYIVVWTERELKKARQKADQLYEKLKVVE